MKVPTIIPITTEAINCTTSPQLKPSTGHKLSANGCERVIAAGPDADDMEVAMDQRHGQAQRKRDATDTP